MTDRGDLTHAGDGLPHLDEDACIDLVAGLLSGPSLDRAMDHLRTCPPCEARLVAAGFDLESIRAMPAPAGWGTPARSLSAGAVDGPGPNSRVVPMLRVAIPLALAAAALIFVLTRLPRVERASDVHPYWIPATGELSTLRGAHSWDADSAFWAGLGAYEAHDSDRASKLLKDSKASGGLEDLRRLYLASTLVNTGQGGDALQILNELAIQELPMPWREDAYWLKFRALTLLHQSSQADSLLGRMAGWPGRVGELARTTRGVAD